MAGELRLIARPTNLTALNGSSAKRQEDQWEYAKDGVTCGQVCLAGKGKITPMV
jgi:hypothetical protein